MARVEGIPDEKKRSVALTLPRIPIKICYTRPQSEINYMSMEIEFGDIGNYQLLQQIGRGRYSQVFDALDRRTDTQVVIKKLLTMDMRKIRRELIYLDILRPGPNIIKSSDTLKMDVRADGFTFGVVFEKVQNIDYRILYRQLDDFQIRYYLYQLLKALEYAHLRGIMHRDVKPGNIVIDHPKKILRLIDWGFGAMYFPGQSYYCGACTLPYRAPELLLGYRLYHYAVDMWSFGCVAAGMIFRRDVFFEGIDERTTLQSIGRLLGRSKLDEYLNKYFIRSSTAQSIPESCEGLRLEAFLRPENQETATCTAMSMLRQVLVYDHQERLTAGEARKHPYFLSLKQGHVHYKRPRQCESAGHVAGQAAPAAYRPMVDDANAGPRPEERAGAAAGPSSGNAGAGPGTHSRDAVAGPGTHSRDAVAGTGTHSSDAGAGPGTHSRHTGAGPGTHSRHTGAGPGTHSRDTGAGPGRHSRDADDSDDDADDGTRAGARKRPRPRARAGAKKKNEETASEIDELPDIDPNFASALEAALSREVGARQRRSSPNEPEPSNQTDTSESFEYNAAEDSFFDEEDNTFDYMETPEDDPDPNCASSNANAPVEDPEELPRDGEGSDERDQDPPQAEHPPLDEDPPQAEHSPLDEDPPQAEQSPLDEDPPQAEHSPLDEDPPQAEHSPLDEDPPQAEHSPLDEDPAQNEDLSQAELPAREENPAHDEDRSRDQDPLRHEDPFRNGDPPRSEDPSRDANSSRDENPPQNEDPQRNDNPPHNEHPQRNEAPSRNEAPQRQEHPSRDKDSPQNEDTPRNGDPSRDEDPPRFETTPQNDDPSHDENPSRKEDPSRTENPRRGEHPNDKQ